MGRIGLSDFHVVSLLLAPSIFSLGWYSPASDPFGRD
jgi:hypothetical protein